tara:strand:- start:7214 stop:7711 length:498 start_codon:yes stop_codon:yes gene_type:complete
VKKFFIVGMPASGKSRLGKYISSMTDLCFIDLDLEIEKKLDSNIKDIFEIKGEKFFRKFETKTLKEIIESESNFILATGGGTPCFNENMSIINNSGVSIFIDVKREILHERISRNDKRPLLSGAISLEKKLSDLYKERIEYYQKSKYHVSKDVRDRVLSIINSYT